MGSGTALIQAVLLWYWCCVLWSGFNLKQVCDVQAVDSASQNECTLVQS